jgi:hypothetical protein
VILIGLVEFGLRLSGLNCLGLGCFGSSGFICVGLVEFGRSWSGLMWLELGSCGLYEIYWLILLWNGRVIVDVELERTRKTSAMMCI